MPYHNQKFPRGFGGSFNAPSPVALLFESLSGRGLSGTGGPAIGALVRGALSAAGIPPHHLGREGLHSEDHNMYTGANATLPGSARPFHFGAHAPRRSDPDPGDQASHRPAYFSRNPQLGPDRHLTSVTGPQTPGRAAQTTESQPQALRRPARAGTKPGASGWTKASPSCDSLHALPGQIVWPWRQTRRSALREPRRLYLASTRLHASFGRGEAVGSKVHTVVKTCLRFGLDALTHAAQSESELMVPFAATGYRVRLGTNPD